MGTMISRNTTQAAPIAPAHCLHGSSACTELEALLFVLVSSLNTIAIITRVCCEAVWSAILATAWLLVLLVMHELLFYCEHYFCIKIVGFWISVILMCYLCLAYL